MTSRGRAARASAAIRWLMAAAFSAMTAAAGAAPAAAQGLGAGMVQGVVKDPTGAVMQSVDVTISNPVSGFSKTATTDAAGHYEFTNLPPNPYTVSAGAQGFKTIEQAVDVRTGVPIAVNLTLQLATAETTVAVVGHQTDLAERDPTAHTDIDESLMKKLPVDNSAQGLNTIVTLASPGVVADSNGFFHPVGDHAQTQFSIDNQPITDQQSRTYANQISPDAVESMEVITGVPPAEYGDKSSLIVHIVTRSGLDQTKPSGSVNVGYGSFKSPTGDVNFGIGTHRIGEFLSASGVRTDRFLDPPEFTAIHDQGHEATFFNRFDARTSDNGTLHLDVTAARSGFNVANTYDTIAAGQHQDIANYNIAPGYSQVIGHAMLFTANAYVRHDHVTYSPSANPLDDTPATISQDRTLTNTGAKADLAVTTPHNNFKFGGEVNATTLHEQFTFGVTDPTDPDFLDDSGHLDPSLAPYDLTDGGSLLHYDQAFTVKQQAAYAQDDITAGPATFNVGLRFDHYAGLSTASALQPRAGMSYSLLHGATVVRASYGRTMETPYNENLLVSAGYGLFGIFGGGNPVPPGHRDEVELGIEQSVGRWAVLDLGYFNKHTTNGYDFNVLFDTPIEFPVAWDHSRLNGFTARATLVEHGGFSAFVVMAHTNAIYYPPGTGGILLEEADGPFRIDHDQKFNATTNLQYTFVKRAGAWVALTWRYDSGLVAGSVGSLEDALGLTADQQAAIGFYCGGKSASLGSPLTAADCTVNDYGATRLVIPAEGTENDLTNPPRIAPRNILDLGVGVDNLLERKGTTVKLHLTVLNLANDEALYNFLSTFGGTHFYTPRAVQFSLGVGF